MTIQERAEKAVEYKRSGNYNCCQALTKAFSDTVQISEDVLQSIAAGFAVGMGTMAATCGALIGANIIAGLQTEGKGTIKISKAIMEKFKETCGAVTCKELKSVKDGVQFCSCDTCVKNASIALGEALHL